MSDKECKCGMRTKVADELLSFLGHIGFDISRSEEQAVRNMLAPAAVPVVDDELVSEGLEYFERAGDAGDRKYVAAIRSALRATFDVHAAVPDDVALDAARYSLLRQLHWNDGPICCVTAPSKSVRLGAYCPSGEQLDGFLDDLLAAAKKEGK